MPEKIYLKSVVEQIPRLLSLLDKNPLSKTYGCFDRQYWRYKVIDFSSARAQESVLTLALLYKNKGNPYYNNPIILNWIKAGLDYWCRIQEKNGSFGEWYPKENSFVVTAFSTYAISETLLQLEIKDEKIINCLKKSANWLLKKHESMVINQEAGASIALYNVYLLTKEEKYNIAAKNKIKFIINNQTEEGWFNEYGGADIGYLSLTISCLADYYKKTGEKEVLNVLKKATSFIEYFCHPGFKFGGVYGSRNTEYLIPYGFEILSDKLDSAKNICYCVRNSLKEDDVFPKSLDDRYLSYILYVYLQSSLTSKNLTKINLLQKKDFKKEFPLANLSIINNKNFYFIYNKKNHGFFIFFKRPKKSIEEIGVYLSTKKGLKLKSYGNRFHCVRNNNISTFNFILLRLFQSTFGRNEKISLYLKNKLRDKLITKKQLSRYSFFRSFDLDKNKLVIKDMIEPCNNISKIIFGSKYDFIYSPSSDYFRQSDLNSRHLSFKPKGTKFELLREYDERGNLKIKHE